MKKKDLKAILQQLNQEADKAKQLENTEDLLANLQDKSMEAPESSLLDRVTAAFRRKQARKSDRPARPAMLQFDSWTLPAPLGVRGGGTRERQLLYSEDEFDLDIQIVKDADSNSFSVRGQLLNDVEAEPELVLQGIELRLFEAEGEQSRRITDEYGRFHFSYCAPGEYSLQVILEDHDILLTSITVKE